MRRLVLVAVVCGTFVLVPAAAPRDTTAKPTGRIVYSHRFWPQDSTLDDNWELFDGGSGLNSGVHVMLVEGTRGRYVAGGEELLGFAWAPNP